MSGKQRSSLDIELVASQRGLIKPQVEEKTEIEQKICMLIHPTQRQNYGKARYICDREEFGGSR